MDLRGLGTSIADGDLDQDVLRLDLGVLDEDVKVPVLIEDAGVEQFILGGLCVARPVGFDDGPVRLLGLRILVDSMLKFFVLDVPLRQVVAVSMDPAPESALAPSFLDRPIGQLPASHYTPFAP